MSYGFFSGKNCNKSLLQQGVEHEKLVILGAGCAGTMVANKLRKKLAQKEWSITIIDKDDKHIYQPGLLFIPFAIYHACDQRSKNQPKTSF